ncbi:hypothetical protein [Alysiella crassa]|nr:hypothetical protein [Alysiella crassa]UOP07048.1 hypothetical protein LVJ80_00740 [Alysiella crassa]
MMILLFGLFGKRVFRLPESTQQNHSRVRPFSGSLKQKIDGLSYRKPSQ